MSQHEQCAELKHYGVKGMRWGRRRFQNADGSLKPFGKKQRDLDISKEEAQVLQAKAAYAAETRRYAKMTNGGLVYNKEADIRLEKSRAQLTYAKEDLADAKIQNILNQQTKKSDRQIGFEKRYKDEGLTQEEAALAAYKRIRTEKIIVATAGVAITAAAAYVTYKHYDNNVDKIIKAGTSLQNISTNSNKGVSDAFYASKTRMDNVKYRGMYGKTLGDSGKAVYETTIGVNRDLKLASRKSAKQVLNELVKSDETYAKNLEETLKNLSGGLPMPQQKRLVEKALVSLSTGKIDTNVYEAVNIALADHSSTGQKVSKGFYDALKTKGYDVIKDVNDSKYSGYKSTNPLIVFNGGSSMTANKVRELGEKEINKNRVVALGSLMGGEMAKNGAIYTAGIVGFSAARSKNDFRLVRDYRKKHPNSKLSYKEIVRSQKK